MGHVSGQDRFRLRDEHERLIALLDTPGLFRGSPVNRAKGMALVEKSWRLDWQRLTGF